MLRHRSRETQLPAEERRALLASARVLSIPMRVPFRGIIQREVVMLRGPQGWAEWGPFVEYSDAEASIWLDAAIEWAYQPTPPANLTEIEVNATLPAIDPAQARALVGDLAGYSVLKLKIAESRDQAFTDLQRAKTIAAQYPHLKLRLDANGRLTVADALRLASDLAEAGLAIDYLEQPVATTRELLELREALARAGVPIRIAADESVRKADDYLEVARLGAADLLVLKVAPLGGLQTALEVAQRAALPIVVSSALETSIGLAPGAWLAAALPGLGIETGPAGLDTARLLEVDPAERPLEIKNGRLRLSRPSLDERLAAKVAANPERTAWWLARLERCLEPAVDV